MHTHPLTRTLIVVTILAVVGTGIVTTAHAQKPTPPPTPEKPTPAPTIGLPTAVPPTAAPSPTRASQPTDQPPDPTPAVLPGTGGTVKTYPLIIPALLLFAAAFTLHQRGK